MTDSPTVSAAASTSVYTPSGWPSPSNVNVCSPAARRAGARTSANWAPFASSRVAEMVATAVVVYVIVVESAAPSPFGLIVAGSAASSVIASGPPATVFPSVPSAGVAPATSIRQRTPVATTRDASQVQSTVVPCPAPAR